MLSSEVDWQDSTGLILRGTETMELFHLTAAIYAFCIVRTEECKTQIACLGVDWDKLLAAEADHRIVTDSVRGIVTTQRQQSTELRPLCRYTNCMDRILKTLQQIFHQYLNPLTEILKRLKIVSNVVRQI
jgi:hypothetical protein